MIDRRTVLITAAATGQAGMVMNRAGQAQGQAKQKIQAIGFDGFTIFDPSSLNKAMEDHFPGRGAQLSTLWRTRQFEYCWLRTLNGKYADFWQVSDDSLAWAFKTAHVELTASVKWDLMNSLLELKPFPDSQSCFRGGAALPFIHFDCAAPGAAAMVTSHFWAVARPSPLEGAQSCQ